MTRGSSYVAQTDVYVHAEERVVTRNDGNLTRAHEAGEGIAICCMASQGHIVGGRTPQSMIKRCIPDGQIPTGDPLASVCPECTNPTSFCPCEYGQPAGTAEYVDPVLAYLVCWAVFGVWPTLFVLYKLLQ